MSAVRRRPAVGSERALIGGSIVAILLVLALGGLAAIDTASIVFTRIRLSEAVDAAAREGAATYRATRDVEDARAAAERALHQEDGDATLTRFRIRPAGAVTVGARAGATTIAARHLPYVSRFVTVRESSTAVPPGT